MRFAIREGIKVLPEPKLNGHCEICGEKLIPKCGEIKIWHWAHKSLIDCDNWAESESEWHLNWKKEFPKNQQEVKIGNHRADIKTKKGVIELQNSSIGALDIQEREKFYNEMVWLLNGSKLCKGLDLRKKKGIFTFRWKHPPKSWWKATKPIFIDLGGLYDGCEGKLFLVKKTYSNIPCGGWGKIIKKEDFIEEHK